jgi:hypothetical protein
MCRGVPAMQGEGADARHLAFKIENRGRNASASSFPRLVESKSKQGMPGKRYSARSEWTKGRIRFRRPGADIAEEGAHFGQPGMRSGAYLFSSVLAALHGCDASIHVSASGRRHRERIAPRPVRRCPSNSEGIKSSGHHPGSGGRFRNREPATSVDRCMRRDAGSGARPIECCCLHRATTDVAGQVHRSAESGRSTG